jgi:hypothetical protein
LIQVAYDVCLFNETRVDHVELQDGAHWSQFSRTTRNAGTKVAQAGGGLYVGKVELSKRLACGTKSQQTWPNRASRCRVGSANHAIEYNCADVAKPVSLEDVVHYT